MPKILAFDFGEEDYTTGMSAQLNCMVTGGDSPVDIQWNVVPHGHSSVTGITTTKIGTKSSVLQIDALDATHSGNYTCTASNKAGMVRHSAQLTVVGTRRLTPSTLINSQFFQSTRFLSNSPRRGSPFIFFFS